MRGREVERERNPRSLKRRGSYDQFIVALSVAMRTIYVTRGESDDVRGGGGWVWPSRRVAEGYFRFFCISRRADCCYRGGQLVRLPQDKCDEDSRYTS